MTSSLVGSEMCIRDRWYIEDSNCPPPWTLVVVDTPSHAGLYACGVGAVSYTHLTLPTICSV
eukprot:3171366-Prorocentrum_lima.AAC.1